MLTLKVEVVGGREAIFLDEGTKQALNVKAGDTLCFTELPDGAMRVTAGSHNLAEQLAMAESLMKEDSAILGALAR